LYYENKLGTGIAIAIALFMAFILYFVIKVQSNSKYDNEWLSKNTISMMLFLSKKWKGSNAHDLAEKPVLQNRSRSNCRFPAVFLFKRLKEKCPL
jgi:hypothetical protein